MLAAPRIRIVGGTLVDVVVVPSVFRLVEHAHWTVLLKLEAVLVTI